MVNEALPEEPKVVYTVRYVLNTGNNTGKEISHRRFKPKATRLLPF